MPETLYHCNSRRCALILLRSLLARRFMTKTTFLGGALSFKGDKKSKTKKKKKKSKHSVKDGESEIASERKTTESKIDEDLTEAEKKALRKKKERELHELAAVGSKSHRDRVNEFNEKLGRETEHNDIPRVSAAGNG